VEHFKFNIENELTILEKYNLTPTELFTIKVILLAKKKENMNGCQGLVK
jgi:hypothetical protein